MRVSVLVNFKLLGGMLDLVEEVKDMRDVMVDKVVVDTIFIKSEL